MAHFWPTCRYFENLCVLGTEMQTVKFGALCLSVITLYACDVSRTLNMYPVEGPAARQTTAPIQVTATGTNTYSGTLSFVTPNGATCSGQWSSAGSVVRSNTTASLYTRYGYAVGTASTVQNAPGVNRGDAIANCSDGNQFQIEFYTGSGTARGSGVAVDRKGNVYRVII